MAEHAAPTPQRGGAQAVLTSYGIAVDSADTGDGAVHCVEFSFYPAPEGVEVIAWTGTWPFAEDRSMGTLPTVEDAARYAAWLYKRDAFYNERDERMWAAAEAAGAL